MRNPFNLSTSEIISAKDLQNTKGGKRFLGTFTSSNWGSTEVQNFLSSGSVSCIGTNQTMKANLYVNSIGDTICIEW